MEEINPNLLSREKLHDIIKERDKEIQSLKKQNSNRAMKDCIYWQMVFFFIGIPTIIVCTNISYSLQQKQINYAYFIIGVIASIYSLCKVYTLNKSAFIGKEFKESSIEPEILLEELSTEELKQKLEEALSDENYKYACLIRDELSQRS